MPLMIVWYIVYYCEAEENCYLLLVFIVIDAVIPLFIPGCGKYTGVSRRQWPIDSLCSVLLVAPLAWKNSTG